MTDTANEDLQATENMEEPGMNEKTEAIDQESDEKSRPSEGNYREASYVVLFIAAVFVINAMETGSYRTPWPVAIVTTLLGLGLFGYSWYLQSRSNT
ncbi:MAG: hypothetical protein JSW69_00490 [Deltaproteobacteria bacterium]|nr:MAG: hypothetical protein JSW69_00490 [Deltaproteobacteria bacterium]